MDIPPRTKRVMELSFYEARNLGHNYVGTEHLLLSLIREGEGVAARILKDSGVDLQQVREQIYKLLKEEGLKLIRVRAGGNPIPPPWTSTAGI